MFKKTLIFLFLSSILAFLAPPIAYSDTPTFAVTSISVDKTTLTGNGSIKLDFNLVTTNFTGPLGKIGIPRLIAISVDNEIDTSDANCYNQIPTLVSGDISNGNYSTTLNFCNQYF